MALLDPPPLGIVVAKSLPQYAVPQAGPAAISPKIVAFNTADSVYVVTPKANRSGAVMCEMVRNVTTTLDSMGGSQERWRRARTYNLKDAWICKKNATTLSGTWSTYTPTFADVATGATGPATLTNLPARTTTTNGDYAEYSVSVGQDGKFTLGFLMTGSSCTDALISIPADTTFTAQHINTRRTGVSNQTMQAEFTYRPGSHTVRVTHNGTTGNTLYVFGANFRSVLSNASWNVNPGSYDAWGYARDDSYYNLSDGANDFAVFSHIDQKWAGSYHGGETASSAAVWRLDGTVFTPTSGAPVIGRDVVIEQQTTIAWATESLTSWSTDRFTLDGSHAFSAAFTGSVTAETFITGMSTSYATASGAAFTGGFTQIISPKLLNITGESRNQLPRSNRYVQRNPTTGQRITLDVTVHPDYTRNAYGGLHVWGSISGPYCKPYNAPIHDASAGKVVTDMAFEMLASFE